MLGNARVHESADAFASNYRDFGVGTVTGVWAWRSFARKVAAAAEDSEANRRCDEGPLSRDHRGVGERGPGRGSR